MARKITITINLAAFNVFFWEAFYISLWFLINAMYDISYLWGIVFLVIWICTIFIVDMLFDLSLGGEEE